MISAKLCHYTTKFNSERHKSPTIFSIHRTLILFFPFLTLFTIGLFRIRPADIDSAKVMQIESRTCQVCLSNYAEMQLTLSKGSTSPLSMQANFVNASIHFAVVLPLLHNDDAKQMQIESRTCQACLGNYAEMQLCLSKVSTNPSTCPNQVCIFPTLVCKRHILHVPTPNNC